MSEVMGRAAEPHYLDLCRVCGHTRGNHRWHGQKCPGGKKVRWGYSAWRSSSFHALRGRRATRAGKR